MILESGETGADITGEGGALEVVRTDSCRKFHADYVTARLITTYLGEGTQWLDEADADGETDAEPNLTS